MMKSFPGFVVIVACTIGFGFVTGDANERVNAATLSRWSPSAKSNAEEKTEVLYTSPSGAFQVVQLNVTPTGDDQSGQEFWIVSTRDESRRTKLYSSEITFPTAFYSAPGERWLFVESHQGSCLQRGDLYRCKDNDAFEATPSFSDRA